MALSVHRLMQAIAAAGSASGIGTPTLTLDFTSSLPGQVTFTRAGSRNAIVAGVLTSVGTNTPAIESWGGVNRGLALEGAQTNLLLQSNNFGTTWAAAQATVTGSAFTGPDNVASSASQIVETAVTNFHEINQAIASQASGTVICTSVFFKALAGSTNPAAGIFNLNQFGNSGPRTSGMVDGSGMAMAMETGTVGGAAGIATNVTGGQQNLANGWIRAWITSTTSSTSIKTIRMRLLSLAAPFPGENYAGVITNGIQIFGAQTEVGVSYPSSYKATTTGTVVGAAESAIISDISWLTPSVGTFIVEHDCVAGVVLGSGANTVLSGQNAMRATGSMKTAFAWSGTTSDLVNNGGATTAGAQPTFGADIRLLATSGGSNSGHIKSLTYYPTRLSVAQMQALTAPASTAQAGVMRIAANKARYPVAVQSVAGTTPSMAFIASRTIGSGDRSKLRIVLGNNYLTDAGGDVTVANTVTWTIALIRVATNEVLQVKFSGTQAYAAAGGLVKIESDDILPSAFPSLSGKFPVGDAYIIKGTATTTTAGGIPVSTYANETGCTFYTYDASVTSMSTPNAAGVFTWTGTNPLALVGTQQGPVPILVGAFVSGDPATLFATGDSIFAGGSGADTTVGAFIEEAAAATGYSILMYALGGQSQLATWKSANLSQYMAYARILVDNLGTNAQGANNYYPSSYQKARAAGINYILRPSLLQRSSSTDSFATNLNQTALLPYPSSNDLALQSLAQQGFIDTFFKTTATRDTGDKWIVNGTAFYATNEGTHPNPMSNLLLSTELQPYLTAAAAALT